MIEQLGINLDARSNVATGTDYMSSVPGVFAAGDMRRGQSLVVWAISKAAKQPSPSTNTSWEVRISDSPCATPIGMPQAGRFGIHAQLKKYKMKTGRSTAISLADRPGWHPVRMEAASYAACGSAIAGAVAVTFGS